MVGTLMLMLRVRAERVESLRDLRIPAGLAVFIDTRCTKKDRKDREVISQYRSFKFHAFRTSRTYAHPRMHGHGDVMKVMKMR